MTTIQPMIIPPSIFDTEIKFDIDTFFDILVS